jgi:hypothetical protein
MLTASVPAWPAALQAAVAARQPAITVMRIIFFIVVSECWVQKLCRGSLVFAAQVLSPACAAAAQPPCCLPE